MYLLSEWRRLGSHLAGVSAGFVAGTEHGGIDLPWVGLPALAVAEHSDVQALEDLGEVNCQQRQAK